MTRKLTEETSERLQRVEQITSLLRADPLPAGLLLAQLNRNRTADQRGKVSLRSLHRDLEWMKKHLGREVIEHIPRSALPTAPAGESLHHRWYYRIAAAEDLIPVKAELGFVSEMEALALQTARAQLTSPPPPGTTKARSATDAGPLANALARLIQRLGLDAAATRTPDLIGVNFSAPEAYDPRHVLTILRAIRLGDAVAMRYGSRDKPVRDVIVQPIRVALTDGEPYLWAWDGSAKKIKTYKIARAECVVARPALPKVPSGLDAEVRASLAQAFRGVSSPGQRGRVTVRFTAQAVPFVRQRRFGGAQTWDDLPDGGARVSFNTHGMEAVRHWLLQFGGEAVAEKPAELVTWVAGQVRVMAERYAASP